MWSVTTILTPLGLMLAGADIAGLYFVGFADSPIIQRCDMALRKRRGVPIQTPTMPLLQVAEELKAYFEGSQERFQTSLHLETTRFRQAVYGALCNVSFGCMTHYQQIAHHIGQPSACRAVAQAHRINPFHIVIPCHRTVYSDGRLGGYQAGVWRKQYLLEHETK